MTETTTCTHKNTQPVYGYLHGPNPQVGDTVFCANGGKPLARICSDCHTGLHAGWGCPDCDWQTQDLERRLCDLHPTTATVLVRPCREHS